MKKPTTKASKAAKVAKTMREYKAGKLKAGIDLEKNGSARGQNQ